MKNPASSPSDHQVVKKIDMETGGGPGILYKAKREANRKRSKRKRRRRRGGRGGGGGG